MSTKKRIALQIVLLLIATLSGIAQQKKRVRIKALKTAYITEALELSSKEAEKFWPIYDAYQERNHLIKSVSQRKIKRRIHTVGGVKNLSKEEADSFAKELIAIDVKLAQHKKKLYQDLKGIISSKKMIKLMMAERSFNKELLKRLRKEKFKRN